MIAVASSGRRFRSLVRYLEHGRSGDIPNRIEWAVTRNLVVDDPSVAARVMQATAENNPKVERPVYHVAVSFHPDDEVTRTQMERVADRLLAELGLAEHQALVLAHADRPHAHLHLVVNRIHPESGKAWDRWQDRVATQRVLREEERALGLHEVPGRLYQLPGRKAPERTAATRGEHRTAERTEETPILLRLRAHLAEYRLAPTWADLEMLLAKDYLRLERKGQGLVITDGDRQVKASRLARDFSFARLQERLGPYNELATAAGTPQEPRAAALVAQARAADHERQLAHLTFNADNLAARAKYHAEELELGESRTRATGREFGRALARLYLRSDDARDLFDAAARVRDPLEVARHLEQHPRAYGELRPAYRSAALGLVRLPYDRDGHERAREAAHLGRAAAQDTARLRMLLGQSQGRTETGQLDAYVHALTHARTRLRHAQRRRDRLHQERANAGFGVSARYEFVRAAGGLAPQEVREIGRWLTAPQQALFLKAREAAREIALGQER